MTGFNIHPAAIINQIKNLLKERYKEGFPLLKKLSKMLMMVEEQTSTICRYSSGEIEPLMGFQLNEGDKNNNIILNWNRCFKQFKHCAIEFYKLNSINKLIKVSN